MTDVGRVFTQRKVYKVYSCFC